MTAIHTETSALSDTTAGWIGNAPTEFSAPPIAAPAVDPISVAARAVLADWSRVHTTMTGTRATNAEELAAANGGTVGILSAIEDENASLITKSVKVQS